MNLAKRFSLLLFLVLSLSIARAQEMDSNSSKWVQTYGIGGLFWQISNDYCFYPASMPQDYWGYKYLRDWQFRTSEPEKKPRILFNHYQTMGIIRKLDQNSELGLGIGYGGVRIRGTNGACLRFNDMLETGKGFVRPSRYSLIEYTSSTNVFTASMIYSEWFEVLGIEQHIGFSLWGYLMHWSNYKLQLAHANGELYWYESDFLENQKRLMNATLRLNYGAVVFSRNNYTLLFEGSVTPPGRHFTQLYSEVTSGEKGMVWSAGLTLRIE